MIIIIGSGLAGYNLAKEIRKIDKNTPLTIVTKHKGRFYSKPQLSTALNYERDIADLAVASAEEMAKQLDATVRTDVEVTKIDPDKHCIYIGEESLSYSKLVFACGAKPIRPPLLGDAVQDVLSVNDLEDYEIFRELLKAKQSIAILGAGLVGCEFANDLVNAGHKVDVIALSTHPVERLLPEEISRLLEHALADNGVRWHFEQLANSVNKHGDKYRIVLPQTHIDADLVMSAIGLKPNTKLAQEAGMIVNRGIVVNRFLQTSAPDVYALGDCAEVNGLVLFYVSPLRKCAEALAKTLTGTETKVTYPAMPVGLKTPACPISICPPPQNIEGDWHTTGEGKNLKSLYLDEDENLYGFVLTGKMVVEKMKLVEQLPPIFKD